MSNSENSFENNKGIQSFLFMASSLEGKPYAHSENGLRDAYSAMQRRQRRVLFQESHQPYSDIYLERVTQIAHSDTDNIFQNTLKKVMEGQQEDNMGIIVVEANRWHSYAAIANEDLPQHGRAMLERSLAVHRILFKFMNERADSELPEWRERVEHINEFQSQGADIAEYLFLRDIIHWAIQDGRFGDALQSQFDPFAQNFTRETVIFLHEESSDEKIIGDDFL